MQAMEEERRRTMQFQGQQEGEEGRVRGQAGAPALLAAAGAAARVQRARAQAAGRGRSRQEQERRRTIEYDNELRQRTEVTKVCLFGGGGVAFPLPPCGRNLTPPPFNTSQSRIEAEGRIEQERKNRDIRDAQLVCRRRRRARRCVVCAAAAPL